MGSDSEKMIRISWRIVFTAAVGLSFYWPASVMPRDRGEFGALSAQRIEVIKGLNAVRLAPEQVSRRDCDTIKECSAVQREKDELVAQQIAAKAATHQSDLAFWQTIVAGLGVVAVIATLFYSHQATKAATSAAAFFAHAERAYLAFAKGKSVAPKQGADHDFSAQIKNLGRTPAIIKSSRFMMSYASDYSNYHLAELKTPVNPYCEPSQILTFDFKINNPDNKKIYLKAIVTYSNMFSDDVFSIESEYTIDQDTYNITIFGSDKNPIAI
ncbi:MAG: hypothetical protein ABI673_06395 [Novosphingobium sp.]